MSAIRRQLLVFRFGDGARFDGQILGALERAESGGAIRVADALFVGRDPDTGELAATTVAGGTGGLVATLADFRLDPGRRRVLSAHALAEDAGAIRRLADGLGPGAAMVAVLVEESWHDSLVAAVGRSGGRTVADDTVQAGDDLAELALAAVERSDDETGASVS